jgi:hypothetical protein
MKYLKMLGLAAVAATALIAFVGAGSASATVFCSTQTTPCSAKWAKGTQLEFSVTAGSSAEWKTGFSTNTCTDGTLKGTMLTAGSGSETMKLSVDDSDFTWTNCTFSNATLEGGELEIHSITGSNNGTVIMKGFNFTTSTTQYGSCNYSAGTGVHLGTLTASGSGEAMIDIKVTLAKSGGGFLCPNTMEWIEEWVQTVPNGKALYVEPS